MRDVHQVEHPVMKYPFAMTMLFVLTAPSVRMSLWHEHTWGMILWAAVWLIVYGLFLIRVRRNRPRSTGHTN